MAIKIVDGVEVELTSSEIAEIEAELSSTQASKVRMERDLLLQATDVFALVDRNLSAEMEQYRSNLRDIPQQSGFPANVTWPTKPTG